MILDKILEINKRYGAMKNGIQSIVDLLDMRRKLSTYLVSFVSTELDLARRDWMNKYDDFTEEKNQMRDRHKDKGVSVAGWIVKANLGGNKRLVTEAELLYRKLDDVARFSRLVLDEMNQRISFEKDEKKQSDYYNSLNA